MRKKIEMAKAWAWEFDGMLCLWAEPTRDKLTKRPTTEAKKVSVYIVRRRDMRIKKNVPK